MRLPVMEERPVPPLRIATVPVTLAAVPPMLRVVVETKEFWPFRNASMVPGVAIPKKVEVATAEGTPVAEVPLASTELAAMVASPIV
jgi:hypothetical protein